MHEIEDFISKRLKSIQKRNNFNYKIGIAQINNHSNKLKDYIIFCEYINLIKKLKLEIVIPYDSLGLKLKNSKIECDKTYVYFARLEKDTSIWKIGHSNAPYKRGKVLQTGNHESIVIFCTIEGDFALEQAILHYTSNFDVHGGLEWRKLDIKEIKLIVSTIKTNGSDFLFKSKL